MLLHCIAERLRHDCAVVLSTRRNSQWAAGSEMSALGRLLPVRRKITSFIGDGLERLRLQTIKHGATEPLLAIRTTSLATSRYARCRQRYR